MARFCGQCGSEIDPRVGFCSRCDAQRINALWQHMEHMQSPEPPDPVPAGKPKRQKREKAARRSHPHTGSFRQEFGATFLKYLLALALVCLLACLVLGALVGFRALEIPPVPKITEIPYVSQALEMLGLDLSGTELPADNPASRQPNTTPTVPSVQPTAAATSPACIHQWTGPSCLVPEVCALCGETGQSALGHQWQNATYSTPKTCSLCALTEGEPLGQIGDTIRFGHYEQDNNTANGPEPLDWEILDISGNDLLLIAKDAIDTRPYHTGYEAVTWADCSLRQWLGSTFLASAFTEAEQARILTTTVTADSNPLYSTDPGPETRDKIYLLSLPEAEYYFQYNSERICGASPYAVSHGAYVNASTGGCWWWLRSPGITARDASSINSNGSIDYDDGSVNSSRGTVRPVMWVNMD